MILAEMQSVSVFTVSLNERDFGGNKMVYRRLHFSAGTGLLSLGIIPFPDLKERCSLSLMTETYVEFPRPG